MSTTLPAVWSAMPATYLAIERAAAGAAGALAERVRSAAHDRAAYTDLEVLLAAAAARLATRNRP